MQIASWGFNHGGSNFTLSFTAYILYISNKKSGNHFKGNFINKFRLELSYEIIGLPILPSFWQFSDLLLTELKFWNCWKTLFSFGSWPVLISLNILSLFLFHPFKYKLSMNYSSRDPQTAKLALSEAIRSRKRTVTWIWYKQLISDTQDSVVW